MLYFFKDDYLFMEELERKLGDWYSPGDSIRCPCPKNDTNRLIVDEFNFYAAVQSTISYPTFSHVSMHLYINGAESKK